MSERKWYSCEELVTARETIETNIVSSGGSKVDLEYIEITSPNGYTKWQTITAIADGVALGFLDARYFPETNTSALEASHLRYTGLHDAAHIEVRNLPEVGDDGFYVGLKERNRGIGSAIFEHLVLRLQEKGAYYLHVKGVTKDDARRFYEKHGGKQYMNIDFLFKFRGFEK